MRSRYTAFTRGALAYLEATLAPEAREGYDGADVAAWARDAEWQGLEIRGSTLAEPEGDRGTVEFVARYRMRGKPLAHHELASFGRVDGRWYYLDGVINPKSAPRTAAKVGRNDPCPCGSGKKYKKCCGG
jgi:SEC-C motif-containing protein